MKTSLKLILVLKRKTNTPKDIGMQLCLKESAQHHVIVEKEY